MEQDLLDLYERASTWTASKVVRAAEKLDAPTPCDDWDVATLMNHMLDTQRYFVGAARGEEASPPSPNPPELLGDDPVADFDAARAEMVSAYRAPGVIEKTDPRSELRSVTSSYTAGIWRRRLRRMRRCRKVCLKRLST